MKAVAQHQFSVESEYLLKNAKRDILSPEEIFRKNHVSRTLVILGSSRCTPQMEPYMANARQLAHSVAQWSAKQRPENKLWLVSGGKSGIMEQVSQGALLAGEKSLGFGFRLESHGVNQHQDDDFTHLFTDLGIRDYWLYKNSEAIVAFPGGLGTIMELTDSLLHMQLGMRKKVPMFLFGSKFWNSALNTKLLIQHKVASEEDLDQIKICDRVEEIICNIM